MYMNVADSEVSAYKDALNECGFTRSSVTIGTMELYSIGTPGNDDYMEVRLSVDTDALGTKVGVIISRIKPSNEW